MLIQFGDFELNTVEMTLGDQNDKVVLEPKVFEVLCYLIENSERYVSMGELHENLWQGRCVSDAAVRRIISKIRAVLKDDHKEPKYLQSLSKRGYRLVCSIEHIAKLESNRGELQFEKIEDLNLIAGGKLDEAVTIEATQQSPSLAPPNLKIISKLVFIVISLVLIFTAFTAFEPTQTSLVKKNVVDTIGGEKRTFERSRDGRFLAYSVKLHGEKNFQIFLKDYDKGTTVLVSKQEHSPLALEFSHDAKSLFYVDMSDNSAHLYQIKLEAENAKPVQLASGFYAVYNVFTSSNINEVYFTAREKVTDSSLIYQLNLDTNTVKQVTHASSRGVYDTKINFSPDTKSMAILRVTEESVRNTIKVLDAVTRYPKYEYALDEIVYDIDFLDNEHLLILTGREMLKINVVSGKEQKIPLNGRKLAELQVSGENALMALEIEPLSFNFIEKRLPLTDFSSQSIFEHGENINSLSYQSNSRNLWAIISRGETNELVLFEKANEKEKKIYLSSSKNIRYVSDSFDNRYVLLYVGNRLTVLDTSSNKLIYVTAADEFVGDADFAFQGADVLYTIKRSGEWLALRFDVNANNSSPILTKFRYLRQYRENYVVGTEERALYYYNVKNSTFSPLNVTLSENSDTSWGVVNDSVFWSTHNLNTTTFNELNISNLEKPVFTEQSFDFSEISPLFYINKYNNSLILRGKSNRRSVLVEYVIN
ncbi:winged helix-turn-helix domain-containing protein [Pseudoalteromonas xiamenensis]